MVELILIINSLYRHTGNLHSTHASLDQDFCLGIVTAGPQWNRFKHLSAIESEATLGVSQGLSSRPRYEEDSDPIGPITNPRYLLRLRHPRADNDVRFGLVVLLDELGDFDRIVLQVPVQGNDALPWFLQ